MKMYIPEIGDHIRLTTDWTFNLHPESRNVTLATFFGYQQLGWNDLWVDSSKIEERPEKNYVIDYPHHKDFEKTFGGFNWQAYQNAQREAELNSESYQQWLKDDRDWLERAKAIGVSELEITLPAGTILAVDRIYIRKGSSDYSSITFWAKGLGESEIKNRWSGRVTKWKAQRFWAKLSDCNRIEFEVEVEAKDRKGTA